MSDMTTPPDARAAEPADATDAFGTVVAPPGTDPPAGPETGPAGTGPDPAVGPRRREPRPVAGLARPRFSPRVRPTYRYLDYTGDRSRAARRCQASSTFFVLALVCAIVAAGVVVLPFLSP